VATCLVTGNLEPIGWAKMEALGISHLFTAPLFGGFGSDFCSGNTEEMWRDRAELVRVAAERCVQQVPGGCCPRDSLAAGPARGLLVPPCSGACHLPLPSHRAPEQLALSTCGAGGVVISAKYHVGDTPNDIQAAIAVGAVPIGVATGIYTCEQLRAYCSTPDSVLLEGLHDVEGMLRVLGL
jgi:hypothetical protein